MTRVTLQGLRKSYGATFETLAVHDVTLEIAPGSLTAFLGPSGCGKTTTLKMIAGLLEPTGGDILFNGITVLATPAERRGAVMVFQKPLLFPYLSVGENVGFGLKMRGVPAPELRRRVADALALVRLGGFERRVPHQLSGGQQQRVALARALVIEPAVLLLDEPLASLDANLRLEMREEIIRIHRARQITTIFVTHDQQEAVMIADAVGLFMDGRLLQYDPPTAFYERPASLDVARFFGSANFVQGQRDGFVIRTSVGDLCVSQPGASGPVVVTIRPEHILIGSPASPDAGTRLKATIEDRTFLGSHVRYRARVGPVLLEALALPETAYPIGATVDLVLPANKLWALPLSS